MIVTRGTGIALVAELRIVRGDEPCPMGEFSSLLFGAGSDGVSITIMQDAMLGALEPA